MLLARPVDGELNEQGFSTAPIRSQNGLRPTAVVIQVIEMLLADAGVHDRSQIAAIGVGVPGLVDVSTGQVDLAVNLDEPSIALGPILENHFGRPVFVENDANAVGLGAAQFLVDSAVENLAFITIGTGVGAGLVLNGKIFHGSRNMAGEIGHMFVRESDVQCQCGNYGCLETFVAGPAIARMAQDHPDVDLHIAQIDSHLTPLPQKEGDPPHGFIVPGLGDAGDPQFGTG